MKDTNWEIIFSVSVSDKDYPKFLQQLGIKQSN